MTRWTLNLNTVSLDHYKALRDVDKTKIGTADYAGLAFFWAYEYRHPMREVTIAERRRVHHAFLAAELALDGESPEHREIINRIIKHTDSDKCRCSYCRRCGDFEPTKRKKR